jgi:hypothetical protein
MTQMPLVASLVVTVAGCAARAQVPATLQGYLRHPGFVWRCETGSHFHFCWEKALDNSLYMMAARETAEPARRGILRFAHESEYKSVIHVFFVGSSERMKELIGYRGEGRSRPRQHAVFFVPTSIRPDLTHELSHEILSNL